MYCLRRRQKQTSRCPFRSLNTDQGRCRPCTCQPSTRCTLCCHRALHTQHCMCSHRVVCCPKGKTRLQDTLCTWLLMQRLSSTNMYLCHRRCRRTSPSIPCTSQTRRLCMHRYWACNNRQCICSLPMPSSRALTGCFQGRFAYIQQCQILPCTSQQGTTHTCLHLAQRTPRRTRGSELLTTCSLAAKSVFSRHHQADSPGIVLRLLLVYTCPKCI